MIEQESNASSPTLTKVTMGEITSFLVKSGQHQNYEPEVNITKQLMTSEDEDAELKECNGDLMEEMEKIMNKMEHVMATFKDSSLIKRALPVSSISQSNLTSAADPDPAVIGRLVSEISDLIHAQTIKTK